MSLVDYSQFGQSLILEQLITPSTPRIVVDIGAHDGLSGSNSRALLEQGWRGLLVEPIPSIFAELQRNCADLPNVRLVQAACSDRTGSASIRLGTDGPKPQMSSLSQDDRILNNLTTESIEVTTTTLADLLSAHEIPADFGVLLIDTEGLDLTVLRGLDHTQSRPRIIVTEDFVGTNPEKYAFLNDRNYRRAGFWGADSFWISAAHDASLTTLQLPVRRLPDDWTPPGILGDAGRALIDATRLPNCIVGWAWTQLDQEPSRDVTLALYGGDPAHCYFFEARRTPRSDVATFFHSDALLMSGFRAPVDVAPGVYDVTIMQHGSDTYANTPLGRIRLDAGVFRVV